MSEYLRAISPVDGQVCVERQLADSGHISRTLTLAASAQKAWAKVEISERAAICLRLVDYFQQHEQELAAEITQQMGRPIIHAPGEIAGLIERARHMIAIAEESLQTIDLPEKAGFERYIKREPVGVVLVLAPWNYPYLTAVNSIIPAIMAGNAVILKHAEQTPLCAERFYQAFKHAELPEGVFQYLFLNYQQVADLVQAPEIQYVAFTGSVAGGRAVQNALAKTRFIASGLELGGKDPAYVRADADLEPTIASLVDGAFFNAGQSCCGIERIYVDEKCYQDFVDGFVSLTEQYCLGDPFDKAMTLGPMVRTSAAEYVRGQIKEAQQHGARALINPNNFPTSQAGTPYLAPQVLVDVDHSMSIMREESFGPVVGIMAVDSDQMAVELMNDSDYGLTASIWTLNEEAGVHIAEQVQAGTVFMNRCDYLDPGLAWCGRKNSGRGVTLSALGYEHVTQAKSYHLRLAF